MRKKFEPQLELGSTPIAEIDIPLRSRDELQSVLRALQQIFCTLKLSSAVARFRQSSDLPQFNFVKINFVFSNLTLQNINPDFIVLKC